MKILLSVCPPYLEMEELLHFAREIGSSLGASITALCVSTSVAQKYYSPFSIQLGKAEREKEAEVFDQTTRVLGAAVKMSRSGELVSQILDEVEAGDYDMLIFGDVDRKLTKKIAEHSHVSTIIFRRGARHRSFLACVDGSENSINVALLAGKMAEAMDTRLTLLSVAESEEMVDQAMEAIQKTKRAMAEHSLKAEEKVRVGKVVDTILREEKGYDLVALGPRGLSRFHRVFLGHVSLNVLEKAESNILLCHL